jgi:hypothetical protein
VRRHEGRSELRPCGLYQFRMNRHKDRLRRRCPDLARRYELRDIFIRVRRIDVWVRLRRIHCQG